MCSPLRTTCQGSQGPYGHRGICKPAEATLKPPLQTSLCKASYTLSGLSAFQPSFTSLPCRYYSIFYVVRASLIKVSKQPVAGRPPYRRRCYGVAKADFLMRRMSAGSSFVKAKHLEPRSLSDAPMRYSRRQDGGSPYPHVRRSRGDRPTGAAKMAALHTAATSAADPACVCSFLSELNGRTGACRSRAAATRWCRRT